MIIYLTYNDQPSGVYWSQVTDVVAHLNTLGGPPVKLIALVSARDFLNSRKRIKTRSPSAWVIPMVPRMKRWKSNATIVAWICRMLHPTGIIARGPFATWLALRMRDRELTRRVCFDGRGAYAAEWEEYRIIDDETLIAQMRPLENEAVHSSDIRIAVSNALVAHWHERYGYTSDAHVVIPCTLGKDFMEPVSRERNTTSTKDHGEVVFAYAGSAAGWQSFGLLVELVDAILRRSGTRLLFLSPDDERIRSLIHRHPGLVRRIWVEAGRVPEELSNCDLGILVREDTITNRVSSPTKFAEYLSGGLPVLISEHLGDFSELVAQHRLGHVLGPARDLPEFAPAAQHERERIQAFARSHFTKSAFNAQYRMIIDALAS